MYITERVDTLREGESIDRLLWYDTIVILFYNTLQYRVHLFRGN